MEEKTEPKIKCFFLGHKWKRELHWDSRSLMCVRCKLCRPKKY